MGRFENSENKSANNFEIIFEARFCRGCKGKKYPAMIVGAGRKSLFKATHQDLTGGVYLPPAPFRAPNF